MNSTFNEYFSEKCNLTVAIQFKVTIQFTDALRAKKYAELK